LNVRDQAAGETGALQSWTLQIGEHVFHATGAPRAIPDNGTLRSAITVASPNLVVPGAGLASGAGGDVRINAGTLSVRNGATVSAVARGSGATGNLSVKADVVALTNSGVLSIRNEATVRDKGRPSPGLLEIEARDIVLQNEAAITAASTGDVDASDIRIRFTDRLIVDPSRITTSANEGNGGDIGIQGSGLLWLDHSQITTSAERSGNGGDIRIAADVLLMETGFVQANTGAPRAQGGDVAIHAGTLLASGPLQVGGDVPFRFDPALEGVNVIQAAAPDGVSGNVALSSPALDVAGDLSVLRTEMADSVPLARDLCRLGAGSSLTPTGRGGLRPTAVGLIRPERIDVNAQAIAIR
jgi:hypothetical protein